MNDVQTAVNEAFTFLASIPVTGDSVEIMAMAKDALRRAYKLAGDKPEEKDDG